VILGRFYILLPIIGIVLSMFCTQIYAEPKNLQAVLEIAKKQSEDLQIIEQGHEAGIQEINSFKASVYPQVNFGIGSGYFNSSTKSFGIIGSSIQQDRLKGIDYNWMLSLDQPVYTFGRLGIVRKMAKSQTKLLGKKKSYQREQFLISIIQMYNAAVKSQVELNVVESSIESTKKYHAIMEIDYKAGAKAKIEWLQAEALLARASAEHNLATTSNDVTINRLKNLIGMEESETLELDVDDNMYSSNFYNKDVNSSTNVTRSTSIKELDLKLAKDYSKYEKARLYPSISLNGQISNQFSRYFDMPDSIPSGRPDSSMIAFPNPDVLDLGNTDFFNYRIGLSLNWTLFDGFRNLSTHRKARALAKIEERNLSKMKKQDKINLSEAEKMIDAGADGVKATQTAREAAKMAYEQAKTDLEAGALSISQYIDIEKQFKEIQLMYYQAKAQELMAHINLKISRGENVFEKL